MHISIWQSNLSVMPPCPGMESPKSLILNALLKPDAKNPPKGAQRLENRAITSEWICTGASQKPSTPNISTGSENFFGMYRELMSQCG
eukprot:CAMPEP_0168321102 /NCGR_PEP_ID=MMETSP0213-20121227/2065_1 /TAXON_ID=151035 /ORGANISM="Euplotes harpa, Strain FSP1.4" /LENGTH=87 /DNA_ID=CAMNT_0008322677 /DNA_START=1 /DNA_END=264 /DNA_ORIENTATION=+